MKNLKFSILVFLILCNSSLAFACDVCGCGMGGQYFGILPQFQRHFIGLRYQQRSFTSTHPALFQYDKPSVSTDLYDRVELWGRYALSNRFQVFGFLPYQISTQSGEKETRIKGFSDPWFMVNWFIINTGDSLEHTWKHALILGAGAKLPIGQQLKGSSENPTPTQLQPGSGSLDFPLHLSYTLRRNKLGLNLESNVRINTENSDQYRFGHRVNSAARIFLWQRWNRFSILPSLGLAYEWAEKDAQKEKPVEMTGGELVAAHFGLDVYFRSYMVQTQWQPSIKNKLGDGNVIPKTRIQIGMSYLF
jgi:hypothetical protein